MRRQLAQRLAHQPRLQTGQRIAHFAFQFSLGRQCRNRINNDQINGPGAGQRINDFKRLLAGVGLRNQQLLQVDAEFLCVLNVQRMFGIDEGAGAADFLHLGNHLQRQRGLARRLGAVDFNHPAARQAADAECNIETQRAGGNHLNVFNDFAGTQLHDGAFAKLLFNLGQRGGQRLGFFGVQAGGGLVRCVHDKYPCKSTR